MGGRIGSLLELGAGFHPDFSGRENVFLNGAIQGLPRKAQIRERFDEIVAFAELENAIDRPVRTYSSGMYMRLGFAIAAHLDADVLLLDEVFAVGDEAFQRKCFGKIFEFKQRGGTIVFVSHDATRWSGCASARSCCGKAGSSSTGRRTRRSCAIARCSPPRPPGRAVRRAARVGYGRGDDRGRAAHRPEGQERRQFLAGEPFSLRLRIEAKNGVARHGCNSSCVTRPACSSRLTWSTRGGSAGRTASRPPLRRRASAALRRAVPPPARPRRRERRAGAPLARRRARLPRLSGG